MTHPTEDTLVRAAAGDLPESSRAELDAHLAGCATCRTTHGRLVAARSALAALPAPAADASFAARLELPERRRPASRLIPLALGGLAVVAAAVVLVPSQGPVDGLYARGSDAPLDVRVFVHEGGANGVRRPLDTGGHLRRGDGLSIESTGTSDRERFLLAFLRDAARDVHWLAPAWIDPSERPAAVPVAQVAARRLPGVTPDAPATGPATLCLVFAESPLDVAVLDAALGLDGLAALRTLRAESTCGDVTIDP